MLANQGGGDPISLLAGYLSAVIDLLPPLICAHERVSSGHFHD